jgi:hypothetical protein
MEFKSEYYNETQIESILISYGFKNVKISDKNIIKENLNFQNYKNNKLVVSFNPMDYGKLLFKTQIEKEILYVLQNNNNHLIKILSSVNKNIIEIFKNKELIIKFIDSKLTDNSFIRIFDNEKFYFKNNQQILFTKVNKSKTITKLVKSKKLINNFITLDIETFINNNIMIPFCISVYDGEKKFSFFLTEYSSVEEMIINALGSITLRKYNGYNIYIHNMAKFDIIFLMKYLVKLGVVKPIIHNGKIISINLNFGKNYTIQFKDSYSILLASLNKLCKGFNVETVKSIFPFLFVNSNNLNYEGTVPNINYFNNNLSKEEYLKYYEQFDNN